MNTTVLNIYGHLSRGKDNFFSSLRYLNSGLVLSNLLYNLSKEKLEYNIIEGYDHKNKEYNKFTKCKIAININDINIVKDLLNDHVECIEGNEVIINSLI